MRKIGYYNGADEIGSIKEKFGFSAKILAGTFILCVIGIYVFWNGVQLYNKYYPWDSKTAMMWMVCGIGIILIGFFDFYFRKDNYLEICEKGIRGKGSTGGILGMYHPQFFQVAFVNIIKIENKSQGILISTRENEIIVQIANPQRAIHLIDTLIGCCEKMEGKR